MTKELAIIITAAMPISELRGAIPLGVALGQSIQKTVALAILGNIIPIIPILYLLEPLTLRLRNIPLFKKFFDWLFARTEKRAKIVERWGALGLILFVAIPLPITGAWTGCIAATLFKIRFRFAFPAISLGVLIAACIVTTLTITGSYLIR